MGKILNLITPLMFTLLKLDYANFNVSKLFSTKVLIRCSFQPSTRSMGGIIVQPDKNRQFDWLISGKSTAVLDRPKGAFGQGNIRPTSIHKQNG